MASESNAFSYSPTYLASRYAEPHTVEVEVTEVTAEPHTVEVELSKTTLGYRLPRRGGKGTLMFFPDLEEQGEETTLEAIAGNCRFAADHLDELLGNNLETIKVKRETLETLSAFLKNVSVELGEREH